MLIKKRAMTTRERELFFSEWKIRSLESCGALNARQWESVLGFYTSYNFRGLGSETSCLHLHNKLIIISDCVGALHKLM